MRVTTRERVFQLLRKGMTQAEIARELGISKPAVLKHVKNLEKDGLWQRGTSAAPEPRPKPKRNGGKPPPPGPHSTGFKPGNPGGPGCPPEKLRGNKNAVKTGEFETIFFDVLDDEERQIALGLDTSKLAQLDYEIRIITIRERRMLQRIERLRQEADELGMTVVEVSHEQGEGPKGPVDLVTAKRAGVLGQIQAIEDALTRVQDKKARLLELKHKIEAGDGQQTGGDVTPFKEALAGAVADAWAGWNTDADEEGEAS